MARLRMATIAITIGMLLAGVIGCGKSGLGGKAPDPTKVAPPPEPAVTTETTSPAPAATETAPTDAATTPSGQ